MELSRGLWIGLVCWVIIPALPASAQTSSILGQGLVNISGNYANQTSSVGAVANRSTADQLFQQALADKSAGLSSFPPNIALLSQALQEVQMGIQADNQSHELAQSAIGAASSGTNSGTLNLSDYGAMSLDGMKNMVNSSSQYWPEVSSQLSQFGLHMSEDGQYMQTPMGTFPIGVNLAQVAQSSDPAALIGMINGGAGKIAGLLGISGDDISKGLQAGQARAQQIAANSLAAAQALAGQTARKTDATPDPARSLASAVNERKTTAMNGPALEADAAAPDDWAAKAKRVAAYRDQMMKNMGVEPIHGKNEDLFQTVHIRYQAVEQQGRLLSPL